MSNVAVIGLGIMGLPMAINLVKAGHTVTGFNRSQDKIDKLVSEGGRGAASIAGSNPSDGVQEKRRRRA